MTRWTNGSCRAGGVEIHYLRTGGSGRPVVLLHGLTGSGACWTPLARGLEGEYDLVMPDARGHGSSGAPSDGYRYEDHASDVEALIRALDLRAPILLGHSMGGMTAAVVASRGATTVRAVILVDPTFLSLQRQREVYESDVVEQHRRLLRLNREEVLTEARARHPGRSAAIVDVVVDARLQTRPGAFRVLAPPNPDYHRLVAAIDVPILLVVGDGGVVSLEAASELRGLNSRVRIEQIRNVGHGIPFDQPERLEAVVQSFLRSLGATPAGARVPLPREST